MEQRYRYYRSQTVAIYDCDPMLRLRPAALLRYIQTVAGEHLDTLGLSYQRLYDEGYVFVIAATALQILRRPVSGEELMLYTAPLFGKGPHMLRETLVTAANTGERLTEAPTSWA